MPKVYLSPSLQEANIGVGKYGTEMYRMRQVALAAQARLRAAGVTVRMSPESWAYLDGNVSLAKVVADSNAFAPALHICIHSNAGPKGSDGTLVFYHPGSANGKKIATLIQHAVAPLSPGSDYALATSPVFYETRAAKAPVAYLECAFHTDYKDAASLIEHHDAYGRAIADACLQYLGIPLPGAVPPPAPVVPLTPVQRLRQRVIKLEARVAALEAEITPIPPTA